MQNRGCEHRIGNGRESLRVELLRLDLTRVRSVRRVNEFLDGDVSITPLSIEVSSLGWRILHAKHVTSELGDHYGIQQHLLERVIAVPARK